MTTMKEASASSTFFTRALFIANSPLATDDSNKVWPELGNPPMIQQLQWIILVQLRRGNCGISLLLFGRFTLASKQRFLLIGAGLGPSIRFRKSVRPVRRVENASRGLDSIPAESVFDRGRN